MKRGLSLVASALLSGSFLAGQGLGLAAAGQEQPTKRTLGLDDLARLRSVSSPRLSPDGEWVAYVVSRVDMDEDRTTSDLWMTSWDGATTLQLTFSEESESQPRWSPDGKYLSFLAARGKGEDDEDAKSQVWVLNRSGGEARALTSLPGGVSDHAWSPDAKRIALIAADPDPAEAEDEAGARKDEEKKKNETPPPIVVDRYQFKRDRIGYLTERRNHLYVFDVDEAKAELLTPGNFDEALPSWSPDGSLIAFSSKREGDPDRHDNWDIYLVEPRAGAVPRQLTTFKGTDGSPSLGGAIWSPDGRTIAYVRGKVPELTFYDQAQLAVIPVEEGSGSARVLTAELDRDVSDLSWSEDGQSLYFLVEDDRSRYPARVSLSGGAVTRLIDSPGVASSLTLGNDDRLVMAATEPHRPYEVAALDPNSSALRWLSSQNSELIAQLELGAVDGISVESADGTIVNGILVKPPGYRPDQKYPTIAYIHGGPIGQDGYEFDVILQTLAAQGYVVAAPNYRGSSGRGHDFTRVLHADWGNLEVQDVIATVDHLIAEGIADPDRLGIGGWSYGGMTTNYTIATDTRFKAAVSGASIANTITGYGTDQYIRQYENELGLPWEGLDAYLRTSYPFFHADRIRTPTLFLCGEKDFNVPLVNSEQMYQALRSLGVPTQLVIYPGQFHGLSKPSYQRDRLERYIAWFGKYLGEGETAKPTAENPSR